MNLFDLYQKIDSNIINEYIDQRKPEDLFFDFKLALSDFDEKEDKRTLSKVVSGFANSSGGIIIWGIETKKNNDGIDCAQAIKPSGRPELFLNRLIDFSTEFVVPIVDDVQHAKIDGLDGVFKSFIPESSAGPHMATATGLHQYFKRSGDDFRRMEHFDLEDMFGRRQRPDLQLVVKSEKNGTQRNHGNGVQQKYELIFGIRNIGRHIAKYTALQMEVEGGIEAYNSTVTDLTGFKLDFSGSRGFQYLAPLDKVIYPSTTLYVARRQLWVAEAAELKNINLTYKLTAEGVAMKEDKVTILRKFIADAEDDFIVL